MFKKILKTSTETSDPQQAESWAKWLSDEPFEAPHIATPPPQSEAIATPQPAASAAPASPPRGQTYRANYCQPARSYTASPPVLQRRPATVMPPTATAPVANAASAPMGANEPQATPTVSLQISIPAVKVPHGVRTTAVAAQRLAVIYARAIQRLALTVYTSAKAHKRATSGLVVVGAVVAVGLIGAQVFTQIKHSPGTRAIPTAAASAVQPAADPTVPAQPTFAVVIPKSRPELAQATAGKSFFDSKRNSYSYNDDFQYRTILVSEQLVPAKFKTEGEALTNVAQQVGAKEVMATANGAAYLGTDAKSGQQTIVYVTKGILIFIQSPFSYTALKWQPYLEALHQV